MRTKKDIDFTIKCINEYRNYLINVEHINKNLFKKFRLSEISGFLYGIHYALGFDSPIQNSLQLIELFPKCVSEYYYDTLNKRINGELKDDK